MSVLRKICIHAGTAGLAVILLLVNGVMSFALPSDDGSTISVSFAMENDDLSDVEFQLFKIAVSDSGIWEFTDPYKKYENKIKYLDKDIGSYDTDSSDVISSLTHSLSLYTDKDGIMPEEKTATDENGKCLFKGLDDGMYLIKGKGIIRDDDLYIPQSCIVFIGDDLGTDSRGSYDIVIKSERRKLDGNSMELKAVKIWSGTESAGDHPDHVDMVLLKDGIVTDKAELSEKNGWKYEWRGLDKGHVWSAAEDMIPDGYVFSPEIKDNTYLISNISEKKKTGDNGPAADTSGKKTSGKLPQTGIMWKSVILLYSAGVMLVVTGKLVNRKKKNDNIRKVELLRR